ncbi:unnamed protein product [Medioppia subpectinata]|uniref:Protein kinase domain-containing protein n=1 Tax=Medioppia subpectinata TaxID=1979941 RepID=A0A7R9KNE1_9ACAR|nr:unnamed protein product [Medioppia subpectinata]CAG2106796.1 unnamed protein product [Medioppia subpectinata]
MIQERNDVLINREVRILQTLNHVNVVRYHAAWREHGTPDVELDKVYIKMDYCDYNLQQVYNIITGSGSQHTQGVGTLSYKAPEVKHGGEYNHQADVFSLGIMLMQFFDVNVNKQDIHTEIKDLLTRMIAGRAIDRPSCSEIMKYN